MIFVDTFYFHFIQDALFSPDYSCNKKMKNYILKTFKYKFLFIKINSNNATKKVKQRTIRVQSFPFGFLNIVPRNKCRIACMLNIKNKIT